MHDADGNTRGIRVCCFHNSLFSCLAVSLFPQTSWLINAHKKGAEGAGLPYITWSLRSVWVGEEQRWQWRIQTDSDVDRIQGHTHTEYPRTDTPSTQCSPSPVNFPPFFSHQPQMDFSDCMWRFCAETWSLFEMFAEGPARARSSLQASLTPGVGYETFVQLICSTCSSRTPYGCHSWVFSTGCVYYWFPAKNLNMFGCNKPLFIFSVSFVPSTSWWNILTFTTSDYMSKQEVYRTLCQGEFSFSSGPNKTLFNLFLKKQ